MLSSFYIEGKTSFISMYAVHRRSSQLVYCSAGTILKLLIVLKWGILHFYLAQSCTMDPALAEGTSSTNQPSSKVKRHRHHSLKCLKAILSPCPFMLENKTPISRLFSIYLEDTQWMLISISFPLFSPFFIFPFPFLSSSLYSPFLFHFFPS